MYVWEVNYGKFLFSFIGHGVCSLYIPFSGQINYFQDPSICWNIVERTKIRSFLGHSSTVRDIFTLSNNDCLFSLSDDETIGVRDVHTRKRNHILLNNYRRFAAFAISNDNSGLFSASNEKQVKIWDISSISTNFILRVKGFEGETDVLRITLSFDETMLLLPLETD